MNPRENPYYQFQVDALARKYRGRSEEITHLLQRQDASAIWDRARRMKEKVRQLVPREFAPCPLCPQIHSVLECNGYTIENVRIQTLPDTWLGINVYIPKGDPGPYPAIVVPMGHWPKGKAIADNQILCANLARNGFVVATFDPICQGERRIWTDAELVAHVGQVPEDMHAVAMHMVPGNLFYMMGKNLMSLFIHDGQRVIDYVCSRLDVDAQRIGVTGQSGGGTQTTYLAVLDDRVKAYSPIQCLSSMPRMLPDGIGDCEQSPIGLCQREAFEYADILWAALPKPVMVNGALRDSFPIEGLRELDREMRQVYDILGLSQNYTIVLSDCAHEISPGTRNAAYHWFRKVLGDGRIPEPECRDVVKSPQELQCLPGRAWAGSPLLAARTLLEAEKAHRNPTKLPQELPRLLAIQPRTAWISGKKDGWTTLQVEGAKAIAFQDTGEADKPICLVLESEDVLASQLKHRFRVVQAMPWAMASAYRKTRHGYDDETCLFNISAVLGQSLMAQRVNQVLALTDWLCQQTGHEAICLCGRGFGAYLALLCHAVGSRYQKTVLVNCPASLDTLFEDERYVFPETLILPGICRLGDIPDIVALCRQNMVRLELPDGQAEELLVHFTEEPEVVTCCDS